MNKIEESHLCRCCGLEHGEPLWGEDGMSPTYDICSCCGLEAGYQDYTLESLREYREEWLSKGAPWWRHRKEQPLDWNLEKQMTQIPEKYR